MRQYSINEIDRMEGHEFEYFCAELLRINRYDNVEVTRGSGDQGIDVIAYKDGIKFGIQCKCYTSAIGNKAVQEAYSGKEYYSCHIGAVLSNRYFSSSAKELAKKNRILLWDRDFLIGLLKNADIFTENDNEENITNSYYKKASDIIIDVEENQRNERALSERNIELFDIILYIDDKKVLRNTERRDLVAQKLSSCFDISKVDAQAKMYGSPSKIAINLSKEDAERRVNEFQALGCRLSIVEINSKVYQTEREKVATKSNFEFILLSLVMTIFFGIITKICWDKSDNGSLGIFIVLFSILTLFSGGLLIVSIKSSIRNDD